MKGKVILWTFSPDSWGQEDVAVVLEIVEGADAEHDVCQDVASKAVEHGTQPGRHRAATGHFHSACNSIDYTNICWILIK